MGNPLQSKLDLTLGVAIGSTPKKEEFARQLQIQFRQTLLHRKGYPSHRPLSWSPLLISRSIFRFLTCSRGVIPHSGACLPGSLFPLSFRFRLSVVFFLSGREAWLSWGLVFWFFLLACRPAFLL